ncbi:TRAP transporter small permease subunit [Alphaproteobacteria bacterium HT1-32]|nr:TRAP transporter small permease subunit [Alphaproteobacteria bacterium HT1-32]
MTVLQPLCWFVRQLSACFDRIAILANAVGTLTVLGLVAVMNMDVVARGAFNAPFHGAVELVIFAMVLIVFLQLPDVVRVNRLTRSDGFLLMLDLRAPTTAFVLRRLIDAVACIFMAIVAYASWPEFIDTLESCSYFTAPDFGPPLTGDLITDLRAATARCDYFGTPGVFTAPWWPARLAITASAGLCAILYLFKVILGGQPAGGSHGSR